MLPRIVAGISGCPALPLCVRSFVKRSSANIAAAPPLQSPLTQPRSCTISFARALLPPSKSAFCTPVALTDHHNALASIYFTRRAVHTSSDAQRSPQENTLSEKKESSATDSSSFPASGASTVEKDASGEEKVIAQADGEIASHPPAAAAHGATADGASTQPAKRSDEEGGEEPHSDTATKTNEQKNDEDTPGAKEESWWRRWWHSFKSEGKDFTLFYTPFYPATFIVLYVAFATNALHKESILDYVLGFLGDYVDRDKMHARIAAWNTWANLGFAFVINELVEVVRFPLLVVVYYATKPYSTYFAHWVLKGVRFFRRRPKVKTDGKA